MTETYRVPRGLSACPEWWDFLRANTPSGGRMTSGEAVSNKQPCQGRWSRGREPRWLDAAALESRHCIAVDLIPGVVLSDYCTSDRLVWYQSHLKKQKYFIYENHIRIVFPTPTPSAFIFHLYRSPPVIWLMWFWTTTFAVIPQIMPIINGNIQNCS